MAAASTKAHALSLTNGEVLLATADGLRCLATVLARLSLGPDAVGSCSMARVCQ